jgi:hypothetical protein
VGRLCNVTYAAIIDEAGALADRGAVREQLDTVLKRASATPKGAPKKGGMSVAQAQRIARDMAEWDAKAAKGQVEA